jgi:dihydroorotate dehydrogenase (fumarate)
MNLSTTYLGLELINPLIVGASPLADDIDMARRLEDAGASAIVMRSLFEEQIEGERYASVQHIEMYADAFAEAASFFPGSSEFALTPEAYLEHIRRLKKALRIPVIASLNGTSPTGWLRYAQFIEQAGADALELNVYNVATDLSQTGTDIERNILDVVHQVREAVKLPLAVKLSPFFTSLPHLAGRLSDAGADGLVLFNRFYQPDIDLDMLDVVPRLQLSDPSELLLRLRWLAILSGRCPATLAASGGVHTAMDALKAFMAGAHAVQLVSAILKRGPGHIKNLLTDIRQWMQENEYESIRQIRGSLSLARYPDPGAFERGNYMRVLNSWQEGVRRLHDAT